MMPSMTLLSKAENDRTVSLLLDRFHSIEWYRLFMVSYGLGMSPNRCER